MQIIGKFKFTLQKLPAPKTINITGFEILLFPVSADKTDSACQICEMFIKNKFSDTEYIESFQQAYML